MARTVLVVAFLCCGASAVAAQLPFTPRPEKDAYRELFSGGSPAPAPAMPDAQPTGNGTRERQRGDELRQRAEARLREQQSHAGVRQPIIVCGTKIIPADPHVDPQIRITPPDGNVEHTLRSITPPICRPQ